MRAWGWLGILAVFCVQAYGSARAGEPEEAVARRARVAELLVKLKDPDGTVRRKAAEALGNFPGEEGIIPALAKALRDDVASVRERAALALERIGGPAAEALPALEKALKDESEPVRKQAASAIGRIREEQRRATQPEVF